MALFRKGPSPHQTALAMIGARAGTRALVAGTPDPGVVAELAATTGLNGQTLLVVAPGDRARYEQAAAAAGVLIEIVDAPPETAPLPSTDGSHDVVVMHFDLATIDAAARRALLDAAFGAVRPGGRVVIIEGRAPGGWFSRRLPALSGGDVLALLAAAGGVAARELGAVDGIGYFEARKARQAQ